MNLKNDCIPDVLYRDIAKVNGLVGNNVYMYIVHLPHIVLCTLLSQLSLKAWANTKFCALRIRLYFATREIESYLKKKTETFTFTYTLLNVDF